jgi:uncharacterized protein YraI
MTSEGGPDRRYRSRTFWLCAGVLLVGTSLVVSGYLDGTAWVTVALGTLTAWQTRRHLDNRVQAGGVS